MYDVYLIQKVITEFTLSDLLSKIVRQLHYLSLLIKRQLICEVICTLDDLLFLRTDFMKIFT